MKSEKKPAVVALMFTMDALFLNEEVYKEQETASATVSLCIYTYTVLYGRDSFD